MTGATDVNGANPAARKLVIQISDTHIVPEGRLYDKVDTLGVLEWTLAAIEGAGAPPDVVLFTGDLTDGADERAYRRFRDAVEPPLARIGCAALFMNGNHDSRPAFRAGMLGEAPSEGPIDQVVWSDGLRIVTVDSTVPEKAYGALDDAQLAWLSEELRTPAPLGTIVALHHPPVTMPVPLLAELSLREPERLGAVLGGTDVLLVVAGHLHCASAGTLAGVPTWIAPASAYATDMAGDWATFQGIPGGGFTRIDVADRRAVVTQVPVTLGVEPLYGFEAARLRAHL